jgi:antitoxin (DNA-binding transcriptional repressor) of toxin-antitoxin stability system
MKQFKLKKAETCLAELIDIAASGEEVIITKNDGSAFKIVSVLNKKPHPKFGSAKGLIEMSDDFDEALEGFEEYIP